MPVRGSGIVFVKFVPTAGSQNPASATQTIYAGVSLMGRPNLFVSTDGGASWQDVAGEPTKYRPTRAAVSSDGFLYIAYGTAPGPSHMTDGAVWKLNNQTGAWTDITPDRPVAGSKEFGYAGVSVDAQHPQTVIASSFGRPKSAGGEDMFRSTDGGATWKPCLLYTSLLVVDLRSRLHAEHHVVRVRVLPAQIVRIIGRHQRNLQLPLQPE